MTTGTPLKIGYTYVAEDVTRGTFFITISGIQDDEVVGLEYGDNRGSYHLSNVREIGKPSFAMRCEVYREKSFFALIPYVHASLSIQDHTGGTYKVRGDLRLDLRDGSLTFTGASLQDREVEVEFVPLPSGR